MLRKHFPIPTIDFSNGFPLKCYAVFFLPHLPDVPCLLKAVTDTTEAQGGGAASLRLFQGSRGRRCSPVAGPPPRPSPRKGRERSPSVPHTCAPRSAVEKSSRPNGWLSSGAQEVTPGLSVFPEAPAPFLCLCRCPRELAPCEETGPRADVTCFQALCFVQAGT